MRWGARVLGLIAGVLLLRSAIYAFEGSYSYGVEGSSLHVTDASAVDGWIRGGLALAVCIVSALCLQRTTLGLVAASALAFMTRGPWGPAPAVVFAVAGLTLGLVSVALMPERRGQGGRGDPREIHIATLMALALVWLPIVNIVVAHIALIWAKGRSAVNDRVAYGVLFAAYAWMLVAMILTPVPGS